ncbi:unnamed protein product, partial [Sphacelaria rigidula]
MPTPPTDQTKGGRRRLVCLIVMAMSDDDTSISVEIQESIQEEVEEYYSDYSLEFDEDEASGRDRTPNRYVDQSSPSKDADEDPPGYEKSPAAVVRDGGRSITSLGDRDPEER